MSHTRHPRHHDQHRPPLTRRVPQQALAAENAIGSRYTARLRAVRAAVTAPPSHVVHLPVVARDHAEALQIAYAVAQQLRVSGIEEALSHHITVSDGKGSRDRVVCGQPVDHGALCRKRDGHDGRC